MGIHRPLLRIFARGSDVSRELPAALLARAVRGMLILALALAGAAAVAVGWPGHHGGGRPPVSGHRAGRPVSQGSLTALGAHRGVPRPWIF